MELWIANGAELGWLINPARREVLVYSAEGKVPAAIAGRWVEGSGPVEGFRLDLQEVWDCC